MIDVVHQWLRRGDWSTGNLERSQRLEREDVVGQLPREKLEAKKESLVEADKKIFYKKKNDQSITSSEARG